METINQQFFDENILVSEPPVELNNNEAVIEVYDAPMNPLNQLEHTIATIFPTNQEENKIIKARGVLGETARDFTDEQLGYLVTDFEYLVDSWLDLFEKRVFAGKTLRELLGESANGNAK